MSITSRDLLGISLQTGNRISGGIDAGFQEGRRRKAAVSDLVARGLILPGEIAGMDYREVERMAAERAGQRTNQALARDEELFGLDIKGKQIGNAAAQGTLDFNIAHNPLRLEGAVTELEAAKTRNRRELGELDEFESTADHRANIRDLAAKRAVLGLGAEEIGRDTAEENLKYTRDLNPLRLESAKDEAASQRIRRDEYTSDAAFRQAQKEADKRRNELFIINEELLIQIKQSEAIMAGNLVVSAETGKLVSPGEQSLDQLKASYRDARREYLELTDEITAPLEPDKVESVALQSLAKAAPGVSVIDDLTDEYTREFAELLKSKGIDPKAAPETVARRLDSVGFETLLQEKLDREQEIRAITLTPRLKLVESRLSGLQRINPNLVPSGAPSDDPEGPPSDDPEGPPSAGIEAYLDDAFPSSKKDRNAVPQATGSSTAPSTSLRSRSPDVLKGQAAILDFLGSIPGGFRAASKSMIETSLKSQRAYLVSLQDGTRWLGSREKNEAAIAKTLFNIEKLESELAGK